MNIYRSRACALVLAAALACPAAALAQQQQQQQTKPEPYKPSVGMAGKDTVWVPTSEALIAKMFDLAKLTPKDFVMDLGSGDGRMIIAAAKRGARGLGVEYNPKLVEYSRQLAAEAGVGDLAKFVEGDMFAADISKATLLSLFLLPENLRRLTPKFLDLEPGTRIVVNTFGIPDWEPDVVERIDDGCESWCEAKLFIVPAKAAGTWELPKGTLVIEQTFQNITGTITLNGTPARIDSGKLKGREIRFTAGGTQYTGQVNGATMQLTPAGGRPVTARRK